MNNTAEQLQTDSVIPFPGTAAHDQQQTSKTGTVRSGYIYDFEAIEQHPENIARASNLKAQIGDNFQVSNLNNRPVYKRVKRLFDVAFSGFVLVCFSWLFLLVAIAVKLDDPKGPVFFKQKRVGMNGKEFNMLKFRSMCVDAEDRLEELRALNEKTGPVFKIAEDPRVTRVGKILRKTGLDELPQFVNVLVGHMGVVGPRPALPAEVATYTDYQAQRLLIKPGITCYWQTRRNRDAISFDEWIDLDLLYIKEAGLKADMIVILRTVGVVLTAQGE